MTEWFEEWFGEEYLQLYPHRDVEERRPHLIAGRCPSSRAGGCSTWPVGPGATFGPGGRAGAPASTSPWPFSAWPRHRRRPLVRADMRELPLRPGSMDLTVNLFTSFGYFDRMPSMPPRWQK